MVISRPRKDTWHIINLYWLVVWNHGILWPSISWEFHNPNWRTPSFFRGVGRKTTNQPLYSHRNVERTSYQWPFQDPKLEVPTIYKAYIRPMKGNIPTNYGLIWYSTSILGSWNSHCVIPGEAAFQEAAVPKVGADLQMASAISVSTPWRRQISCFRENLGSQATEDLPAWVNIQKTMENHHVSWVNPL